MGKLGEPFNITLILLNIYVGRVMKSIIYYFLMIQNYAPIFFFKILIK